MYNLFLVISYTSKSKKKFNNGVPKIFGHNNFRFSKKFALTLSLLLTLEQNLVSGVTRVS